MEYSRRALAAEDRNTEILRLKWRCAPSNQQSLYQEVSRHGLCKAGFPWGCPDSLHFLPLTHVEYFPPLVTLWLKIDMRKVFRSAISNIIHPRASWMTAWCVTNPNLQGNLVQTLLGHQIQIRKGRCKNRLVRDSGGSTCQTANWTWGKKSGRSPRGALPSSCFVCMLQLLWSVTLCPRLCGFSK